MTGEASETAIGRKNSEKSILHPSGFGFAVKIFSAFLYAGEDLSAQRPG